MAKASKENSDYDDQEAQQRFEAALRAGLKTPHKPLKEEKSPKVTQKAKKTKATKEK
jgi:hypothetical protein